MKRKERNSLNIPLNQFLVSDKRFIDFKFNVEKMKFAVTIDLRDIIMMK